MRTALFFLLFSTFGLSTFAAVWAPQTATAKHAESKPPKRRVIYQERKGTMGFVAALVLGPVGYFGVRLCTRSEVFRYKAKRGLLVWATVVTAGAVLFVEALTRTPDTGFLNAVLSDIPAN